LVSTGKQSRFGGDSLVVSLRTKDSDTVLQRQSVHEWIAVVEASATATSDEIAAASDVSLAWFAPSSTDLTRPPPVTQRSK
jgi:hypothetical protein